MGAMIGERKTTVIMSCIPQTTAEHYLLLKALVIKRSAVVAGVSWTLCSPDTHTFLVFLFFSH